jgi:predicted aldo/keto reductase-like oxidoreductase
LTQGDWILLDVVVNEVRGGDVKTWCQKQKKAGLVKNITDKGRVDSIEINNNYQMINQTTFKSEGDTFIIAYAKNNNLGIFSMESPRTGENELFKIPDVCTIFNIPRTKNTSVFLKSISYKA